MKYFCRIVLPVPSEWYEINGTSPGDAVQNFHLTMVPPFYDHKNNVGGIRYIKRTIDTRQDIYFATVEVEIEEFNFTFASKIYNSGIYRKGGILPVSPTLEEVAKAIEWAHEPNELLNDWGEESWEEAYKRKAS